MIHRNIKTRLKENESNTKVLFLAVVILFAVDKLRKNGKAEKYNLPPGPKGLPILGTFPSFLKAPAHIVFQGNCYRLVMLLLFV